MNAKYLALPIMLGAAWGTAASAQSFDDLRNGGGTEVRVSAGISIPLGGQPRQAASKPRFDFGFDQKVQRDDVLLLANPVRASEITERRRMSLSLTFENSPRLMLNGAQVARFNLSNYAEEDDSDGEGEGGNTALLVGGAVLGGLLIASAVTLADGVDAIEDLTDPD